MVEFLRELFVKLLNAIPVSEQNKWIICQLRVAFLQELKRRTSAVVKTQVSL